MKNKKKTILIFGISSFLGSNLAEQLKDDYKVVGTYFNTEVDIEDVLSVKCDINNKDLVQKIVFIFKPDITIYALGLSDINDCQDFPKVADALNTAGVFNVSMASERYHSKFIYFSSSYIFSGEDIEFKENDTPMPSTIYGNTVASSEFYIQKSCLNYIILRCSPLIGRSYNGDDISFLEAIERSVFLNEKMICDSKVLTGFLDVKTVCDVLKLCIDNNLTNRLFQVSSQNLMTRFDFAKEYLSVFGGNSSLISKGDWEFPRTENQIALQGLGEELFFKMATSNVEETFGIKMPSIRESLILYKKSVIGTVKSSKLKDTDITFI